MIIYSLHKAGGDVVATSSSPISDVGGVYRDAARVWLDPEPGDGSYVSQTRDLASERGLIWTAIKEERDRRKLDGGYPVSGKWFHSDTFSRTQQLGLLLMGANIPQGLQWKTMDGSFVEMTQTLAAQVFAAAAAQDQALFAHAEALLAEVNAAQDPAAVDISVGWPSSYSGG